MLCVDSKIVAVISVSAVYIITQIYDIIIYQLYILPSAVVLVHKYVVLKLDLT